MKKIYLLMAILVMFFYGCGSSSSGGGTANAQTTVISSIQFYQYENTETDGIASVTCPANMVPISAGGLCNITTTGTIFSNRVSGNGAICACFPTDLDGYDEVFVYVMCARAYYTDVADASLSTPDVDTEPDIELQNEIDRLCEMREAMIQELN